MTTLQKDILPRLFRDGLLVNDRELVRLLFEIINRIDGTTPGPGSFTGLTMSGNITMTGAQTVDGRDLSVDGAYLDKLFNIVAALGTL